MSLRRAIENVANTVDTLQRRLNGLNPGGIGEVEGAVGDLSGAVGDAADRINAALPSEKGATFAPQPGEVSGLFDPRQAGGSQGLLFDPNRVGRSRPRPPAGGATGGGNVGNFGPQVPLPFYTTGRPGERVMTMAEFLAGIPEELRNFFGGRVSSGGGGAAGDVDSSLGSAGGSASGGGSGVYRGGSGVARGAEPYRYAVDQGAQKVAEELRTQRAVLEQIARNTTPRANQRSEGWL